MATLKTKIKTLVRAVLPPVVYGVLQRWATDNTNRPRWNTLTYEPLNGFQMFFDERGSWQSKMMIDRYDSYLFDRLRTMDLTNKVIYDVGAHIGFDSFYASALAGSSSKVHAFEPHPSNAQRMKLILEKNTGRVHSVSVHQVALSDKSGTEEFNLHSDIESGQSSANFIGGADTFWNKEVYARKGFQKTTVVTVPIDRVGDELGIQDLPDILKIDVEGAEYLVLQGARNTLLSKRPMLFIEIHSMLNMFNVVTFLRSISYEVNVINTDSIGVCFIEAYARE